MREDELSKGRGTRGVSRDTESVLFEALANPWGREVLQCLEDRSAISLKTASERVASREYEKGREELTEEEKKPVYVGLYQTIVPRMDNVDVVDYEEESGRISPGEMFETAQEYLNLVSDTPGDSDLSVEMVFELAQSPRRRMLLEVLEEEGGEVELNEAVDQVAAKENDLPVDQVSKNEYKSVYTTMYLNHLPKMDKVEIIDFDEDQRNVTLLELDDRLADLL